MYCNHLEYPITVAPLAFIAFSYSWWSWPHSTPSAVKTNFRRCAQGNPSSNFEFHVFTFSFKLFLSSSVKACFGARGSDFSALKSGLAISCTRRLHPYPPMLKNDLSSKCENPERRSAIRNHPQCHAHPTGFRLCSNSSNWLFIFYCFFWTSKLHNYPNNSSFFVRHFGLLLIDLRVSGIGAPTASSST